MGVTGVFPSVTYPSHTTIITGRTPLHLGIYYNAPFEATGQIGRWFWESELIKVPTLWDAVRRAGLKSASFIWPVSVHAPIDYNLPEFWSLEEGFGRIEPMREKETPKGLLAEMELNVLGKLNERTFNGDYLNRIYRLGCRNQGKCRYSGNEFGRCGRSGGLPSESENGFAGKHTLHGNEEVRIGMLNFKSPMDQVLPPLGFFVL